jgi:hypothetical protein
MKSNCAVKSMAFVVFFLIQSGGVWATAPRTAALGGDNSFFEDDSNVLRWYGSLLDYGNQVLMETGSHNVTDDSISWSDSPSGPGAGIHMNLDSQGTWGTVALYYNSRMRDSYGSSAVIDESEDSFTVMYGRKIGPVQLAMALRQGSLDRYVAIDTVGGHPLSHQDFKRNTLSIGLRADLSSSSYFDFAFDVHRLHWLETGFGNYETLDSKGNFSLRTRAFFSAGSNMAVVPIVEYHSEENFILGDWSTPLNSPHANTMLRIGCGLNVFPDSDSFMLLSADYRGSEVHRTEPFQGESTRLHDFNILLATEKRWNHWLTIRGSLACKLSHIPSMGENIDDVNDAAFPLSFGAGLHLGGFDLDLSMATHQPGILAPNWYAVGYENQIIESPGSWFSASLRYLF